MARAADPATLAPTTLFKLVLAIPGGALLPDATVLQETADALAFTERLGDEFALLFARFARGITLVHRDAAEREAGFTLLAEVREAALQERFGLTVVPIIDIHIAQQKARCRDLDGAIELARIVVDDVFTSGGRSWSAVSTTVLVDALLQRSGDGDLEESQAAIDRLAAQPTDHGFVLNEMTLLRLRAVLARARGEDPAYRDYRDRYRAMARSLGFEGHMKWAEEMP
jgi:adenylate cyclase